MFYDLDDPNKFIYSVNSLHPDGIFIAQLMTLAPMLEKKDLGNVCHEHLEYYSYKSLVKLYEQNGLEIFKVVENDIQGGSYQIWARKLNEGSIEFEEDIASLETFMYNVEHGLLLRTVLKFTEIWKEELCVWASTKGNTMLQLLFGLFEDGAEIHPDKIGRYTVLKYLSSVKKMQRKMQTCSLYPTLDSKICLLKKEKEWIERTECYLQCQKLT